MQIVGTWIEHLKTAPTMTFVVITQSKPDSAIETDPSIVSVFRRKHNNAMAGSAITY